MATRRTGMNHFSKLIGLLFVVFILVVLNDCLAQWNYEPALSCDAPESDAQALFDYVSFYYCSLMPNSIKAAGLVLWLLLVIMLLASTADNFFVPTLEKLSEDLGLSEEVAGVTLLALGNGMPDLMTGTSSINKADDFSLVMGDIFGAACFVLSIVLGFVLLCSPGNTTVEPRSFLLSSSSYTVAAVLIFIISYDSFISLTESICFFIFYGVYVTFVLLLGKYLRSRGLVSVVKSSTVSSVLSNIHDAIPGSGVTENGLANILAVTDTAKCGKVDPSELQPKNATSDPLLGLDTEDVEGVFGWIQYTMELPFSALRHISIPAAHWNSKRRALSALCPLFATLICALGFGGAWGSVTARWGPLPAFIWALIIGAAAAALVLFASEPKSMPRWHPLLLAVSLVTTIAWFNILANECVAILETFGLIFHISPSTLGITVLAWGNCVGDLVADTALARQGKAKMAVAGVFGSLIFSDALGLGVALTAYTSSGKELQAELSINNKFAGFFVMVSVSATVLYFVISRFSCSRWWSSVLFAEYICFMIASVYIEIRN